MRWVFVLCAALVACGSESTGGASDAGTLADASASDASVTADAGHADAGVQTDAGESPTLPPGDYAFDLTTLDGRARRYLLHVPATVVDTPPLVLNIHGGGGSAEGTSTNKMIATSDRHGFLLVAPEGIPATDDPSAQGPNATWNTGVCCGRALQEDVDDVAYFDALLDDLLSRFAYDTTRVYATGISNGSMMSYRLACERADRITAIAPVAGQAGGFVCNPSRPVPVLHIHGTEDNCATYGGGAMCGGCFQRFLNAWLGTNIEPVTWPCDPVEDYVAEWRTRNDCAANSTVTHQQGAATCRTWTCSMNSEVTFCSVVGMGHTWPGSDRPSFCDRMNSVACRAWLAEVGTISQDIDNELIWAFFARHVR